LTDTVNELIFLRKSKDLEAAGIKEAESGNLDEALRIFDQAVDVAPDRPASYNNRAQVTYLIGFI
jgi:hypothetical protein